MSVGPVTGFSQQQFFTQRTNDMDQLRQALMSGNLAGAQSAYNDIVSLGQQGPLANGAPFAVADRENDFLAIGQALQAGDLTSALSSLQAIHQSFVQQYGQAPTGGSSSSSSVGPAAVVNLSGSH